MKKILFTLLYFCLFYTLKAQLNVHVNLLTKDSIITTLFDTLTLTVDNNGKFTTLDKVVAVRSVHKNVSSYWLFFYFLPTDDYSNTPISIKRGKYAYFNTDKGTYLRIPYNGKPFTYHYPQMAGFFIEISNYLELLKHSKLQFIRLETSQLYHEINLKKAGENKIAVLLQALAK